MSKFVGWGVFLTGAVFWLLFGYMTGHFLFADYTGKTMVGFPEDFGGWRTAAFLFWWLAPPVGLWFWVMKPEPPPSPKRVTHGSAGWCSLDRVDKHRDFQRAKNSRGILLGTANQYDGQSWTLDTNPLTFTGETSLLTVGPAGSGKGTSAVIPNLLFWSGSIICVDPKGENASVTARRRRELGQSVHVIDPWEIAEGQAAESCRMGFNPLAGMAHASEEEKLDLANLVADALVVRSGKADPHWNDNAERLILGLIIHCLTAEPPERQSLNTVREYTTRLDLKEFLLEVVENPACGEIASRAAASFVQKSDDEGAGVLSSVHTHLAFLDNLRMRKSLAADAHGLDLSKLKEKASTVYLCIPNPQIQPMNRWLRLFVNLAVMRAMETKRGPYPLLFVIDEFPALGKLALAERAVAEGRGYGLRLWPIVQDLNQLKEIYEAKWETFVANSGVFQVLGANDQFTAEYVSKRLGKTTVSGRSTSTDPQGEERVSISEVGRALMTPDEVMQLQGRGSLVFAQGLPGLAVRKINYLEPAAWRTLYDANPYHV